MTPSQDPRRPRFTAIVRQPGGPANRYRVNARDGAIVLDGVDADLPRLPVEYGEIASTRDEGGRPLRVAIAVRLPTCAGCTIPVHLVGLARDANGAPLVIAVPAVDPVLAPIASIAALPTEAQSALGMVTGTADEAIALVRAAQEAYHRARREEERSSRRILAWKASEAAPPIVAGKEVERHTFAENAVRYLPARFQEYIERALLPEERILHFIHRPAMTIGGRLRKTRLREGIAVITDRQVLLMTDSVDADATFVHWGYIGRSTAVERLTAVAVREESHSATLSFTATALRGSEVISFVFPPEASTDLREAAALLARFAAAVPSQAVRRLYPRALPRDLPGLAVWVGGTPPAWTAELLAGDHPIAWAEAPSSHGGHVRAVVGEYTVALAETGRGTGIQRVPLDEVTSLELKLSLTGCRLTLFGAGGEQSATIRFDYGAASPFLTVFTAARHLLGLPPAATQRADQGVTIQ